MNDGRRARMSDSFGTSQNLSMCAMEEASRWGHPEADLEHLLVALVLSEEPAGRALRGLGVDLAGARRAVEEYHADALRTVGIDLGAPAAERVDAHETGAVDLSDRALEVLRAAGGSGCDASTVLRSLLDEPSGVVVSIIERCGTTAARVRDELAAAESRAPRPPREGLASRRVFVPASPAEVLAVVRDPRRRDAWDPTISGVEPHPSRDDAWVARVRESTADGRPTRVRRRARLQVMRRGDDADGPDGRVTWCLTWPGRRDARASSIGFEVVDDVGGSLVTIWMSSGSRSVWRRAVMAPFRPLVRVLAGFHVQQLAWQLGRSFR